MLGTNLGKSDIIQRSDLTRWSYAMQVTRWHLLIGWSEVYSRGCTSTSPIFLPRHPSHILESEAASKDKHDKPRERERERSLRFSFLFRKQRMKMPYVHLPSILLILLVTISKSQALVGNGMRMGWCEGLACPQPLFCCKMWKSKMKAATVTVSPPSLMCSMTIHDDTK